MKKLNKFKIASFFASCVLMITPYIIMPDSFLFWGEPEAPLEKK